MGKLKYLVIHCSATPATMTVTKGMLEEWHKGPCDQSDGGVRYLEKNYKSRADLPEDIINSKPILHLKGRGWARLGYSILIHRNGMKEILTPFDGDNDIENDEITWGATGVNSISRHICLEGGGSNSKIEQFSTLYTEAQKITLIRTIKEEIEKCPTLLIAGHNDFANKTCPNFDVHKFLLNNILEKNNYEPKKP